MPEQFLHGVEVQQLTSGKRPVSTVKSSIIGVAGTAPNSEAAVAASVVIGEVANNNAIKLTADAAGKNGNAISVTLVDPGTADASLSVVVTGNAITVNLATDSNPNITSTAAQVIAAIEADGVASALVGAADETGSDGSGVVAAIAKTNLTDGDDEPFPLNTPVLVAGSDREKSARLGTEGTLFAALEDIFDQGSPAIVVTRVAVGIDDAATQANVIGNSVTLTGLHALRKSKSALDVEPRLIIAPEFSHVQGVAAEIAVVASKLRAQGIIDAPNTDQTTAKTYADNFSSKDLFDPIYPWVKVVDDDGAIITRPASARVAGLFSQVDNTDGFWHSPSNREIKGIVGLSDDIDFVLGDSNSEANLLNESGVNTIIRENGYRLWGNRTRSSDPAFKFVNVKRTADIINESLLRAHLWAVDRNITGEFIRSVADSVNDYLRSLINQGAILGGQCWPDPDLNTEDSIAAGKVYFNFDFTPPTPAENVIFKSYLTTEYLQNLVA